MGGNKLLKWQNPKESKYNIKEQHYTHLVGSVAEREEELENRLIGFPIGLRIHEKYILGC